MDSRIKGTTRLLGLIGSPVGHSGSPAMHNYGFQALGIDAAYLAFDIKEDQVKRCHQRSANTEYAGAQCDHAVQDRGSKIYG